MTDSNHAPLFAAESLELAERTPATTSLRWSSRSLGWNSILIDELENHGNNEESWEGFATSDVKISVGLAGAHDLWAMRNGRWASAVLHGSYVNVGGSGECGRLRWRNRSAIQTFRGDCQEFRVRAMTTGRKEPAHGTTQSPAHSGRAAGPASGRP